MRLHVAAQAFPTGQGTQTIIRAMLQAEAGAGVPSALIAYPQDERVDLPFPVLRPASSRLSRSDALQRSGPSLRKVFLDGQLTRYLRAQVRRLQPQVVIAHHVEAAAAALLSGAPRVVFFAHTDMAAELPVYARPELKRFLALAGRTLDQGLLRACDGAMAISPALAQRLSRAGANAHHVAPPFLDDALRCSRSTARATLDVDSSETALAYVGNLDAYQGVERLPRVVACLRAELRRPVRLLVGTRSDPTALLAEAERAGVTGAIQVVPLAGARTRGELYGAADAVLVPRRTPGGLPIKLLDALSHGAPTVVSPTACAGLSLNGVCAVAADESPEAMAAATLGVLLREKERHRLADAGPKYVRAAHSPRVYLESMDRALASDGRPARTRSRRPC